jgi:TusA-related sulfurtransferase
LIDARELAHPEPFVISTSHLKEMTKEDYIYMLNSKNPILLLQFAKEKNFKILSFKDKKNIWHILITKNQNLNLEKLLDV